jgi:ATP-binding cassette subfamily B protein
MPADAVAPGGSRLLGWLVDRVHARRWPRVRQQDASDCGAACLAAVGRYHGARAPVALLRQLAGTDRAGTTLLGLAEAAARIGLAATGVRGAPDCLARVPLPAIAHLAGPHGAHHYVVLYRVSGRAAVIMDPADGRLHRSALDEFVRRWSGVLLLIAPASSAEPLPAPPSGARRLWLLVRPHRTVLGHALAGAVVHTLLGLATAVYVQKVVDHVIPDGNRNLLDLMTAVLVALLVVQAYVGVVRGLLTLRTAQRIDAQLVTAYYAHLLRLPQRFFDTMRVGEIVARVNDAVKIRAFVNDVALDLVVSALVVAFSVTMMALHAPWLALLALASAPLYWAIYQTASTLNRRHQRALAERTAELESQLVESVAAAATIKRFAAEPAAELRTETRLVGLLRAVYAAAAVSLGSAVGAELLSRLLSVALLWTGSRLVLDRALTPGGLMSCYALLAYLTVPLGRLVGMGRAAQEALVAAERLFEVMDLECEDDAPRLDIVPEMVGDLRFDRVSARHGGRSRVLHEVSFVARRGAITAVVGESGSGKSTLAGVAQRIYPADGGRVWIGEHDVAQLGLRSLRRTVGVVPQRVELLAGTIVENVALGDPAPDVRRVAELCRRVGLGETLAGLPHGLFTEVGERAAALSGGQQQRVALARALYHRPAILVLDEATAALDAVAERQVLGVLRELAREGRSVLLVAHRLSSVVLADRIVVLAVAPLVEEGSHGELLRRGGAYGRLWAHQHPAPVEEAA